MNLVSVAELMWKELNITSKLHSRSKNSVSYTRTQYFNVPWPPYLAIVERGAYSIHVLFETVGLLEIIDKITHTFKVASQEIVHSSLISSIINAPNATHACRGK